mmetsp:Transcript_20216/g.22479  ORF Transcript_20216/g.22479 Transcript_20216/m.22479 type:complete len:113 (+) Transcript_20216:3-341(+)
MIGSMIVVLANTKRSKLRGVASEAMIVCACSEDGSKKELLKPPTDCPLGEKITCEGYDGEPDAALNPKKKVWDKVKVDLRTNDSCEATYKGITLTTSKGACKATSLSGCSLK